MSLFKKLFQRKQERKEVAGELEKFAKMAGDFGLDHQETLIILADPKTDLIFMSYQGIAAPVRIMDKDGSIPPVVSNAIKHTRGQADIDKFLLAVDGGLFAIANAVYNKRKMVAKMADWVNGEQPPAESKVRLESGAVLSPIQLRES